MVALMMLTVLMITLMTYHTLVGRGRTKWPDGKRDVQVSVLPCPLITALQTLDVILHLAYNISIV